MTVLDLIKAIENTRGGYDDPIVFVRPIVGREPEIYAAVDFYYDGKAGDDGEGQVSIVLSRQG